MVRRSHSSNGLDEYRLEDIAAELQRRVEGDPELGFTLARNLLMSLVPGIKKYDHVKMGEALALTSIAVMEIDNAIDMMEELSSSQRLSRWKRSTGSSRRNPQGGYKTKEVMVCMTAVELSELPLDQAAAYVMEIDPRLEGMRLHPRFSSDGMFVVLDVPVWAQLNTDDD